MKKSCPRPHLCYRLAFKDEGILPTEVVPGPKCLHVRDGRREKGERDGEESDQRKRNARVQFYF